MKRFVMILMIFVLVTSSAHAERIDKKILNRIFVQDYMDAYVTVEPWPDAPGAGRLVFYDDDKCILLPAYDEYIVPMLYDVGTHAITELQSLPEDDALWTELIMNELDRSGFTEESLAPVIEKDGLAHAFFVCAMGNVGYYRHYTAGEYVLLNLRSCAFLIDTESAVIRPAGWGEITEDGTVIEMFPGNNTYTLTAQDGTVTEVQMTGDPGYDWYTSGLKISDDSAVVIVRDARFDMSKPQDNSVGFIDDMSDGNVTDITYIGQYPTLQGPDSAILCGNDAAIVYNNSRVIFQPCVLVRRGSADAAALLWDGEKVVKYQLHEVRDDEGEIIIPEGFSFLIPVGATEDGRYALFVEGAECGLVALDLDTMECRILIEGNDVYEVMQTTLLMSVMSGSWNGENYINLTNGYTLRFEFE